MNSEKTFAPLYAKRSFGDKLAAMFDFFKETWKPLFKFAGCLLLPVMLAQAACLNAFTYGCMGLMTRIANGAEIGYTQVGAEEWERNLLYPAEVWTIGSSFSLLLLCTWLGATLLAALVFALIQTYTQRQGQMQGLRFAELKPKLVRHFTSLFKLSIIIVLLGLAASAALGLLAALSPFTLIVSLPLLLAAAVPLWLYAPAYLLGNRTLTNALQQTYRIGMRTWGGTFVLLLMIEFCGNLLQGSIGLPWSVGLLMKQAFFSSATGDGDSVPTVYALLLYVFAVCQIAGTYLAMVIAVVASAYQYGHASTVDTDSPLVEESV
ncbi:MAG: hypothetical protein RRY72_01780 [Bacteroides sp.]